ncbi:tRNA lysidine(34) synthetase TilS [Bombilactobacillus folatiphilus]|uniref:tRNA(Ile)-lysidine synthase n=1 Tax=Bombilactobacillus folatiphilus TaxID=2923362 RepID=A0ABY4P9I1_9LACO|nr:tRNA lysidine(34) synthetase TilS [Bombilactobacillus folatiphilus]UQS82337.1 tRNA lysidine(34) synthetase TilS [Bombilactobacillus folatiphilus]
MPQTKVLVAVSGGSDSLALLMLLINLPANLRPLIHVATVDFALRKQSVTEVAAVRQLCQQYQLPFYTTTWQHSDQLSGLEQQARKFRYQYFATLMHQNHLPQLLVAHQSDDQAETVLMKLIRSGSLWELAAMRPCRPFAGGQLVRPLLNFSKAELRNYLKRQHIRFFVDQTNFENITWRNQLRNQVLPQLQQFNPQVNQHLTSFAQQLQAVTSLLQENFQQLAQISVQQVGQQLTVNLSQLAQFDDQQISLFVQYICHQRLALDLTNRQLTAVAQLLSKSNARLALGHQWSLVKSYQFLHIKMSQIQPLPSKWDLSLNQPTTIGQGQQVLVQRAQQPNTRTFYFDHLPQTIQWRSRQVGDRLRLLNGHHQKLKNRLINLKIPYEQRQDLMVLTFDEKIVWIPNIYRYQIAPTPYLFELKIGD